MKIKLYPSLAILVFIILVFQIYWLFGLKEPSSAVAQSCVSFKPCYCILCREGSGHSSSGATWRCSEDGAATLASDDNDTGQGCKMKMKIITSAETCSW